MHHLSLDPHPSLNALRRLTFSFENLTLRCGMRHCRQRWTTTFRSWRSNSTLFLHVPGADFPGLQAAAGENLFTDAIASTDSQELELAEETEMEGEDFGADDDWQGLNDITLNAYASAASRVSLNRNIITEVTELVTEDDAGGIGGQESEEEEEDVREEDGEQDEWPGLTNANHVADQELLMLIDGQWVEWPPEGSVSAPLERG